MTWHSHYIPPDQSKWYGGNNIKANSCFFQTMQMLNLLEHATMEQQTHAFALIGFKCDEGIHRMRGRRGAAEGPLAIRQAFGKLSLHKKTIVTFDAGNISCLHGDMEIAQEALASVVALLLSKGLTPIVLGGSHELCFGHFKGINKLYTKEKLGIINFDAHLAMQSFLPPHKPTAQTAFAEIAELCLTTNKLFDYNCIGIQKAKNSYAVFATAKKYHSKIILAEEIQQQQLQHAHDFIERVVDENQIIYVSISLDVFAACFAPGVSNIQSIGLHPWQVIPLLRELAGSGKVVSYDLTELAPRYDIDHRSAQLAAELIYEIIHFHQFK